MSFLEELAAQRARFLAGLDANQGDINLDIFEDFYPDQAHFVFELLQNAEDAGASEVSFTLSADGCAVEHDGTRAFTESDVRAITGIHNSTKGKISDQIGKFGIGFKSVFVYTLVPAIHSGEFSFQISRLVMPEPIEKAPGIGKKTRFWLPFNNPKKLPELAYSEISSALRTLAETTLLFLSNIESISWRIGSSETGEVLRVRRTQNHFEVLKQVSGKTATSAHFLRFTRPVIGLETHEAAVAFALDFLPNVSQFEPEKPISQQLKIVPARPGRVAVFFPAEKETSGLRFHVHAPFVPELSRASIKEVQANVPLFEQLATLIRAALPQIRDLGLLTTDFLAVLPNPKDVIPTRYECIRTAVIEEMNSQPLTPTHSKSHAPAKHLLQARAALKELLSDEDLEFLVEYEDSPPLWACPRALEGTDIERFMSGLAIERFDIAEFVDLLTEKTAEGSRYIPGLSMFATGPDDEFMDWLSAKPVEWHQKLYSLLYAELSPFAGFRRFTELRIIRLFGGTYSIGRKCFFPTEGIEADEVFPRVDLRVYTSGRGANQQQGARKFLEAVGVREVGEADQVEAILRERYTATNFKPHKGDLKRFIALVEKDATKAKSFAEYYIFEGKDERWRMPSQIYLDKPFLDTGLSAYYDALGEKASRSALADRYAGTFRGGAALTSLVRFAESVGASVKLNISHIPVYSHPLAHALMVDANRPYVRSTSSKINDNWEIENLGAFFKAPSERLSLLLWNTLRTSDPRVLYARYRPNKQYQTKQAPSSLTMQLRDGSWVPQVGGAFVRPAEASSELLPREFPYDPGWQWLKELEFGKQVQARSDEAQRKQAVAKELGFADKDTLERARRFAALPSEEQARLLFDAEHRGDTELPDRESSNPARRAERVRAQAADAPTRDTEERTRSVSVNRDAIKESAKQYLMREYTVDGQIICQVCKKHMPFKRLDGTDYFEVVEFLPSLLRHHEQNYLALCANHAAMFKYANESAKSMRDRMPELTGNELSVIMGQREMTIYLTKVHIADLSTLIEYEGTQSGGVGNGDSASERVESEVES